MSAANKPYPTFAESLYALTRMGYWVRLHITPAGRFQVILHASPESGPIDWGKNFEGGDTPEEAACRVLDAAIAAKAEVR